MKLVETAGGVVVNNGKVLLVEQEGSSWSLPKGHVDEGEKVIDAAKREILEETGITQLQYVRDLGIYQRYRGGLRPDEPDKTVLKNIHIFLFYTKQTELKPQEGEAKQAKWVPVEEVASALTYPKDKVFFESIIDRLDL